MPSERGHYEEGTMERALWRGHYENKSPQADQSDCSIRHSYVLIIIRGQRSYATIFTGVKLGSRGKQEQHRSKKSKNDNLSMDV